MFGKAATKNNDCITILTATAAVNPMIATKSSKSNVVTQVIV